MPPVGKVIGAALGGAWGLGIGASLFLPGLGTITAAGLAATALLGAGGAVAGGAAGTALDAAGWEGLPVDELYLYEDALRKGRSVLIAYVADEGQAESARAIMAEHGAESLDAAREDWWVGLRSAEELEYQTPGQDFATDEPVYRRGFEAALSLRRRGQPYEAVVGDLRKSYPDVYDRAAFRRGYERGMAHARGLSFPHRQSSVAARNN
jgi:hypothetical protein